MNTTIRYQYNNFICTFVSVYCKVGVVLNFFFFFISYLMVFFLVLLVILNQKKAYCTDCSSIQNCLERNGNDLSNYEFKFDTLAESKNIWGAMCR